IVFALILAFAYNSLCTRTEERLNNKVKEVTSWFDELHASGRLPADWNREKAMVFCETLIGLETEVSYQDGRNLTAIDAFREIFTKSEPSSQGGAQ
ncbi:MAG: hypothetical protein NDJ90_10170, partial [Oligoflexia bacterium]|nr:hypothetical protein [Oligoflexia bacterium]